MRRSMSFIAVSLLGVSLCQSVSLGANRWGLDQVGPELISAGPIAFGPDAIILVGDAKQAAVIAIATGDDQPRTSGEDVVIASIGDKIAEASGVNASEVTIHDIATNPLSKNIYLSVQIRKDQQSTGEIWIAASDSLKKLDISKASYAKLAMPNAPADKVVGEGRRQRNLRDESITGLTYAGGRVLVSGMSANEDPSSVWEFQFPFGETNSASSVEIYHAAHGRYEDDAAIRSFVTMDIDGKPTLLAGYTCTPLVKVSLDELTPGEKVRGTTVAELGNMNRPLDMLVYKKEGKSYVLMTNSARGTMKISTDNIEQNTGLSEPVKGGGTAGQAFEKMPSLDNLIKIDLYDEAKIVALQKGSDNTFNLQTLDLP